MEIAYLHLITNHIPIVGVPFALAVLIIGLWRKSDELKSLSFLIFGFLGVATVAVYFLGQGGEDFVEDLAGVSEDAIEKHKYVATFALASVILVSLISIFILMRYGGVSLLLRRSSPGEESSDNTGSKSPRIPTWISLAVLILGLLSAGVLGYTGRLGGAIRHPEFHTSSAAASETKTGKADPTGDEPDAEKDASESGKGRGRNRGGR